MKPNVFTWKTDWPNAAVWTILCNDPRVCTTGKLCAYPQRRGRFEEPSEFKKRYPNRELTDVQIRLAGNLIGMRTRNKRHIFIEVEFYRGGLHLIMSKPDHERLASELIADVEHVLTYSLGPITFCYSGNRKI